MTLVIDGATYFSQADVERELGLPRQTIWRWRAERVIPQGQRYRGHRLVFTADEVARIRDYANRLEPASAAASPNARKPEEARRTSLAHEGQKKRRSSR